MKYKIENIYFECVCELVSIYSELKDDIQLIRELPGLNTGKVLETFTTDEGDSCSLVIKYGSNEKVWCYCSMDWQYLEVPWRRCKKIEYFKEYVKYMRVPEVCYM